MSTMQRYPLSADDAGARRWQRLTVCVAARAQVLHKQRSWLDMPVDLLFL